LILIDTNIAIDLRDGNEVTTLLVAALPERPFLSMITRIELEGGVYRDPYFAEFRRRLLDALLLRFPVLNIGDADLAAYGQIIARCGFDQRRISDRLIAAQAIARNANLITAKSASFSDIRDLKLIAW
jgi:tRNA(fMet)-specific endonuclease VapC